MTREPIAESIELSLEPVRLKEEVLDVGEVRNGCAVELVALDAGTDELVVLQQLMERQPQLLV
jgi:hypothetical protein